MEKNEIQIKWFYGAGHNGAAYRNGGSSYHVWNSNGIDSVSESDWSINGTAVRDSVYVPLN